MLRAFACFLVFVLGAVQAVAADPLLDKLCGVWVDRAFMERLRQTRSPVRAMTKGDVYFLVADETQHPELFDPDQYGQGLVRFQLAAPESWGFTLSGFAGTSEPGVYEPVFGPGADRTDREYRFTLDAAREPVDVLTWELWDDDDPAVRKRLKQTYERAGSSFEEIVNELVIAGAYRDQRGRKYRFNRDGTAACDGKEFEYGDLMPDTNSPYAPVDLIDVLGSTYKYKWMNGKFYLYRDISNEFENEEPVFSRKPDIVLTPVSE
jgi:hypothetical protein